VSSGDAKPDSRPRRVFPHRFSRAGACHLLPASTPLHPTPPPPPIHHKDLLLVVPCSFPCSTGNLLTGLRAFVRYVGTCHVRCNGPETHLSFTFGFWLLPSLCPFPSAFLQPLLDSFPEADDDYDETNDRAPHSPRPWGSRGGSRGGEQGAGSERRGGGREGSVK